MTPLLGEYIILFFAISLIVIPIVRDKAMKNLDKEEREKLR